MPILSGRAPILEQRLCDLHIDTLNDAAIVREFMGSGTDVQDAYRVFRHEVESFDPHNIDIDEARKHIGLLYVVIEKLPDMGLQPERLSQQVFELGGCLPPHTDDRATTVHTVATLLMPMAHLGRFSVYDKERNIVAESMYAPGDMIMLNQKPPVLHSAGSERSQVDAAAGFTQRILWSLDCVRF